MKPVLGIIPARGGSKTIPRKNLAEICGRPLLSYTAEAALNSRLLTRTVLSTDDAEIAEFGKRMGVDVPFMRPSEHATDAATIEAVVAHALSWLKEKEDYSPAAFVILHPTTPLRNARHIDEAIEFLDKSAVDSVVSVSAPMEHPCDMVYFKDQRMYWALPNAGYAAGVQRQGYPDFYFINGAVYVTRTSAFYKTGTRFGSSTLPYFMDTLDSIDIDTKADFIIANLLLQYRAGLTE